MISTTVLLLSTFVGLLLWMLLERMGRRNSNWAMPKSLPGPRGLPLIGNAFQMDRRRAFEALVKWRGIYGDIYQLKIFGQPVVVLGSPATIHEALIERGRDFAGRPKLFYRAGFMSDSYQDIVSGSPGPIWNVLRKTVQRELKMSDPGLRRLEQLTGDILEEMMQELDSCDGRPVDPRSSVYDAVMNMTCLMLVDNKFHRDDEDLVMYKRLERLITTSMSVGGEGFELDVFPWLRFFGNKTFEKLREAKALRDVLYDRIRSHVDEDRKNGRVGLAHALLAALDVDRNRKSGLTTNNVKLAIVNLLIGGASATTGYIYVMLNILAQYPQVQDCLRTEVDAIVGRTRRVGLADRSAMPYTTATVYELLRYASLSPVLIPHMTVHDTQIGAHRIPAGVQAFFLIRAVHHDEEFWGDPYTFRPERFLQISVDGRQPCLVPPDDEHRRRLMSFGGGPRACPGEAIALMRLFLAVATVVQRFVLKPDHTGPMTSCDPRSYDTGLVLNPKDFRVQFIRR